MEIKISLMNKQGKLESKTIKTEINNFNTIISRLKVKYNTCIECLDLDRGIAILDNGLIVEDIAQNKKFKKMLKYM